MSGADGDAGGGRRDTREATSDGEQPAVASARDGEAKQDIALVLIAEDEVPIAEALAYIIKEAGYESICAGNGKQALEIMRTRRPALIITDLMMPLMDGGELIVAIYAELGDGAGPVPPIVLMTAGGLRRAQEVGADEVLRKPFDVEEVEEILKRYINSGWQRPASGALPLP